MTVPQGDQTEAEENWSVIGVLWHFSMHSGIGHDCWEMNSSPFAQLLAPSRQMMSKASVRQFFLLMQ